MGSTGTVPFILKLGNKWMSIASRSGRLFPGKPLRGGWVGPRLCLEVLEKNKIPAPTGVQISDHTGRCLATTQIETPSAILKKIDLQSILTPKSLKTGKVKVKFTLEQAMKAQRESRGIALLFL